MNKKSGKILMIAVATFLVTVSIFGYTFFEINKQGQKVDESKRLIGERLAKETSYNKVENLLRTTKNDRDELSSFFIEEKDTISFVSEIEKNAKLIGVDFHTNNLSIQPEVKKDGQVTTPGVLIAGFDFSGNETAVRNFLLLLENIPYDKSITSLSLVKIPEEGWKVNVVLQITMKYD